MASHLMKIDITQFLHANVNDCYVEKSDLVDVETKDYTIHEVVEEYLKLHSPISPKMDGRAYCEYLGVNSFSTVPGTDYIFK